MQSRFYLSLMLISGLVLIVFVGIATYSELTPEWQHYQSEYKDLLVKNAKDDDSRKRAEKIKIGVQQIYLDSLKKADRCMSCHRGVENPLMANAELPYKQHSGDYLEKHPVNKFGCTVCHNGQGRATDKREAHGEGHETYWDFPIMPFTFIQSACAQCHDYEMLEKEGGERVAKGEKLFREKGCKGCHKVNGIGGDVGKTLDGIGSKPIIYFPMKHVVGARTTYNWIKQHFDDPRAIVPESEMKVIVTNEESELLTNYVMTIKTEEVPSRYKLIKNIRTLKYDGESLYKMYCIACHADGKTSVYDEVLDRTIPAIKNTKFLRLADDDTLKKIINDGRAGTQMTAWKSTAAGLADDEINKIIKYISQDRPLEMAEAFNYTTFKTDVKSGEELYNVRCAFCHGKEGKGGKGGLGINLRNPVVQKTLSSEFLAKTVRDGREGTPMPPFGESGVGLKDQDIADVVAYVRTLATKK